MLSESKTVELVFESDRPYDPSLWSKPKNLVHNAHVTNSRNPLRADPTQTATLRRVFVEDLRRRLNLIAREIREVVEVEDAFGLRTPKPITFNVFCPTGKGGGIDPTCGKGGVKTGGFPPEPGGKIHSVVSETNPQDAVVMLSQGIRPDFKRERLVEEFSPGAGLERGGLYVGTDKSFSKGSFGNVRLHLEVGEDGLEVPLEMKQLGYKKGKEVAGQQSLDYVLSTENGAVTVGEIPPSVFKKVEVYNDGKWNEMSPKEYLASQGITEKVPRLPSVGEYEGELKSKSEELFLRESNIRQLVIDYNRGSLQEKKFFAEDLGLLTTNQQSLVSNQRWKFRTTPEQLQAFLEWLKERLNKNFLDLNTQEQDRYWQKYVLEGYKKGAGRAFDDVKKGEKAIASTEPELDFYRGTKEQFLKSSFGQPESIEKVKLLASRVFTDLEGVSQDMSTKMSRTLTDGLVQGQNPRTIARTLVADLEFSKTRAETIARTEIIRAHAEGALDALEELGVEEIGVMVEWDTAGDGRVCPKCQELDGVVLKIQEAHGLLPRHPSCRCAFLPANVGESHSDQIRSKTKIESAFSKSVKAGSEDKGWLGQKKTIAKNRPKAVITSNDSWNEDMAIILDGVRNVFCPTGKGGGIDPTCGKGGSESGNKLKSIQEEISSIVSDKNWLNKPKLVARRKELFGERDRIIESLPGVKEFGSSGLPPTKQQLKDLTNKLGKGSSFTGGQAEGDPGIAAISSAGKSFSGENKIKRPMTDGHCHWNAALLYESGEVDSVVIGYAHIPSNGKGVWHQHTWGLKGGKVVETTPSNDQVAKYFGKVLSEQEAEAFVQYSKLARPGSGKMRQVSKSTANEAVTQEDRRSRPYLSVNVFCPTGKGGGIDPTCGKGGVSGGHLSSGSDLSSYIEANKGKVKFTDLQLKKIEALNQTGVSSGVLKVPKAIKHPDQIEQLKAILPPGTLIKQVSAPASKIGLKKEKEKEQLGISVPPSASAPKAYGELKVGQSYVNSMGTTKTVESITKEGDKVKVKFQGESGEAVLDPNIKLPKPPTTTSPTSVKPLPTSSANLPVSLPTTPSIPFPDGTLTEYSSKKKYVSDLHGKFVSSNLSNKEKEAIEDYTNIGYEELNKVMRSCPPEFDCVKGALKDKLNAISSAIDKAPPFDNPVLVNRGMSVNGAIQSEFVSKVVEVKDSGGEFQFTSFTSTSVRSGFGGNVRFEIAARKGLYAAPVSSHHSEQEVILSPKSKFKVLDVVKTSGVSGVSGRYLIKLEEVL